MNTILPLLLAALSFGAPASPEHAALFRQWQKMGDAPPAVGEPEAIGSYSAGCLVGATDLPKDGTGYSVMRLSRRRFFGHPELIRYIRELGKSSRSAGLAGLLIGDLGRAKGGPMISGHASHQVGLDVDIWYRTSAKRPNRKERETWSAVNYVNADGAVTKAWSKRERKLVALAAASEDVARIFVHAGIKRDLCKAFPREPWLAKLRPWWGHADHLHVRLKCPAASPHCESQDTVEALGPQCGAELDWWFSQEAKDEWQKKSADIGRVFPPLPAGCRALAEAKP